MPASRGETRIEIRSADPTCNPYLAFTFLIYAIIDGIKNNLVPPEPVTVNLFDSAAAKKAKLQKIPASLEEAKKTAEQSSFVKNIIG